MAPPPTLGNKTEAPPPVNLDLEEEKTEGNAVVAMPQLIRVLAAMAKVLWELWGKVFFGNMKVKGKRWWIKGAL